MAELRLGLETGRGLGAFLCWGGDRPHRAADAGDALRRTKT